MSRHIDFQANTLMATYKLGVSIQILKNLLREKTRYNQAGDDLAQITNFCGYNLPKFYFLAIFASYVPSFLEIKINLMVISE